MAGLPLPLPQRGPVGQPQFGTAATRFSLFLSQPLPQGRDQIVVGQLVIFLTGRDGCLGRISGRACGIGGRDQPDLVVQNADQVVELRLAIGVSGDFQQLVA